MAILFADNFEGYGNTPALMLNGLYAEVENGLSLVVDPDPNAGGGTVAQFHGDADNSTTNLRRAFPKGTVVTAGVAFRLWLSALPANNNEASRHIDFRDSANNTLAWLSVLSTGVLRVTVNNGAAHYDTPAPVLVANAWTQIEMKYSHSGAGECSFEVRIEGATVLTEASIPGADSDVAQVAQYRANVNGDAPTYMKDFVAWDTSGAHNNDFLGTVSVVSMVPDADVVEGWTPSTGTMGYPLVNQSPPDDTDDYLTAPYPPPPASTFSLTDLPVNVSTVKALITQVRARKVDGGDGDLQAGLLSNAVEVDGANRAITTAFTYYEDVFEIDPNTGGNWSPAAADAVEIKINRTL